MGADGIAESLSLTMTSCRVGLETILREQAQAFGEAQMSAGRMTIARYAGSQVDAATAGTQSPLRVQPVPRAMNGLTNQFDWLNASDQVCDRALEGRGGV